MAANTEEFDLDNPRLAKSIKKAALRSGGYPYAEKLDKDTYKEQLLAVHQQLALFQEHMTRNGDRVVMVFEGRDSAGKGGTIKTYLQELNPRFSMTVALTKPSDRERTQWYFQRYVDWLPAAGEQVLFDRSWYNRAGVERVMGFCTPDELEEFFRSVPEFERMLVRSGIILVKYWFSITDEEQEFRFKMRIHDPLKQWKLSPMDLESRVHWEDYTKAKEEMFDRTHTTEAPWWVVQAVDKKRARLNCIAHLLTQVPYEEVPKQEIALPPRVRHEDYARQPVPPELFVPERY